MNETTNMQAINFRKYPIHSLRKDKNIGKTILRNMNMNGHDDPLNPFCLNSFLS